MHCSVSPTPTLVCSIEVYFSHLKTLNEIIFFILHSIEYCVLYTMCQAHEFFKLFTFFHFFLSLSRSVFTFIHSIYFPWKQKRTVCFFQSATSWNVTHLLVYWILPRKKQRTSEGKIEAHCWKHTLTSCHFSWVSLNHSSVEYPSITLNFDFSKANFPIANFVR